jgi:hypothetical protein
MSLSASFAGSSFSGGTGEGRGFGATLVKIIAGLFFLGGTGGGGGFDATLIKIIAGFLFPRFFAAASASASFFAVASASFLASAFLLASAFFLASAFLFVVITQKKRQLYVGAPLK